MVLPKEDDDLQFVSVGELGGGVTMATTYSLKWFWVHVNMQMWLPW